MIIAAGLLLVTNAAWNLTVWPRFLARIARDPRARDGAGRATAFLTAHAVLTGIAGALGALSGVAGAILLRRGGRAA